MLQRGKPDLTTLLVRLNRNSTGPSDDTDVQSMKVTQNENCGKIRDICVYEFSHEGSCPRKNCKFSHNFTKEQRENEIMVKKVKERRQGMLKQMIKNEKSATDPFLQLVRIMIQEQS
jgi:hypothetical protein